MNPKRDAQNYVLFRAMTPNRSGDLGRVAAKPMTLVNLYELRSDAPKLREAEPRFLTGVCL
jgi:hypothetical protein